MATRRAKSLEVLKDASSKFFKDDMSTYAAALAYRMLFALFPFLIFLVTLLGFFHLPTFFDWMRTQAAYMLPAEAMKQVNNVLQELQTQRRGLMSLSIALSIWSASAGILGTMNALNVAYDVRERRPGWKRFLVSIAYTIGLAAMLVLAAGAMITGPQFLAWIANYVGLGDLFIALWTWLRWGVAVFLLMLVVAIVYYAAPNLKQRFTLITPGSLLAVAVWIAASLGFSFYVQNFGKYSDTYGSMGAIIVLLFYFYLSSAVLLFGAEVNAVLARKSGERIDEGT